MYDNIVSFDKPKMSSGFPALHVRQRHFRTMQRDGKKTS